MMEALDWLRSVFGVTRLRGGRTPACWRNDLARETAPIAVMRRACDWVGQIAAISPSLRDGSLFGDCLAELTGPADAPPPPEPEAARSPRRRLMKTEETPRAVPQKLEEASPPSLPSRSKSDCDSAARSLRRSFPPDEVCPAQSVARIQPRADRSLLCRLAGEAPVVNAANQRTGAKLKKECETTRPVSPDRTKSHRDLLRHLAERAEKSLNRSEFCSEFRLQAGRPGSRNRPFESGAANFSAEGGTPNSSPSSSLANVLFDQWALPLDGPPVSSESLNELANEPGIRDRRTGARLAGDHAGESSSLSAFDGARLSAGARRSDGAGASEAARSHSSIAQKTIQTPKPATNDGESGWPLAAQPPEEQNERDETGQRPPARIAPPSLTPPVPALLPSQLSGVAAPPVAPAVSRNGARREEAEGKPDDLGELAEKIQRILNEEARRHGISV